MNTTEFLAALPDEAVAQMVAAGKKGHDNPCAAWLGAIASRELARRMAAPLPEVAPLVLEPADIVPTLAWLDIAAERAADLHIKTGDAAAVLVGAFFDTVRGLVEREAAQRTIH